MNKERIKILLIDDDEDDYVLTRDLLSEVKGRDYNLEWIANYDDALRAVCSDNYDVCLFDYRLGARTGLELLHETVAAGSKVPIILLTGQGDHDVDMEAMKAGAADYLNKKGINTQMLERSIRYAIKHKEAEKRILHMAYYDDLTGLPNRALFHDRLQQSLAHSERYKGNSAILFLDLDNFKRINDTLNHSVGDLLLKAVAERLSKYIRIADTVARQGVKASSNTVARLGGDEFTVLLTEINSLQDAAKVAQRILNSLSVPFRLDGHEVFVSGSIGIAVYPFDGEDMDSLLRNADTAMYHAKNQGKNNFQFYKQSMNATAFERLTMENDLRKAVERNELILYYQPKMDIRTGKIIAVEALLRWNHPDKGLLAPAEFISLAEETGLIIPIGEWVLKTACNQNKVWQRPGSGFTRIAVSVNLSGQQFKQEGVVKVIEKVLHDSLLGPEYLELEITESVIMKNAEIIITMFHNLKNMGVQLSMDDFGTGYSSFSYLKRFPLDIIKIDRSFIKDISEKNEDAAIVKAIIAMAHTLKLRVVAEGVETEQQLELLRKLGCDEMQGYLLSTPLPADEIPEFLVKHGKKTV
ncbi:MAG TPA: EAL domain-containing protein [Nitrospirae bacterium]|nr:EAL domain-containing protein [Nitrospirota bacterium]